VSELGQEDNPDLFIQLGDDVIIESITYGRTIGTVYYRSLEMIHVKPNGVSNDVHRFAVEQTEEGEERFQEEDGVSAIYILKKREVESFVEQQNIRVNHIIDTFDQDRKPYKTYKVTDIRIYSPSLHTYNGAKTDAEILIIHTPILGGKKLFVSVPIMSQDNSLNIGSKVLTEIMKSSLANVPNADVKLPTQPWLQTPSVRCSLKIPTNCVIRVFQVSLLSFVD
jgi:hypothetical protein